jgi:hypothetical protein
VRLVLVLLLVLVLGACSHDEPPPLRAPQANLMGTVANGVFEDPSSPVRIERSIEDALWLGSSPTETATRELLRRTAKQQHEP